MSGTILVIITMETLLSQCVLNGRCLIHGGEREGWAGRREHYVTGKVDDKWHVLLWMMRNCPVTVLLMTISITSLI